MIVEHGANLDKIKRKYQIKSHLEDYSANINTVVPSFGKELKETYINTYPLINNYPDSEYHRLKTDIAEYEEVKEKYIICGNGAITLLYDLIRLLKLKEASIIIPTFMEYEKALRSCTTKITYVSNIKDCTSEALIICNPNNPDGNTYTYDDIETFLKTKPKQYLIVDESFIDFTYLNSSKKLLTKYQNLIIIKSYTKIFALAGLRVGIILTSNEKVLNNYPLLNPCWSLNIIAQEMLRVYLKYPSYLLETKEYYEMERKRLVNELSKLNYVVTTHQANYILFYTKILNLQDKLIKQGYLIRDASTIIGLKDGYYRICIKDELSNNRLLEVLNKINVVKFT